MYKNVTFFLVGLSGPQIKSLFFKDIDLKNIRKFHLTNLRVFFKSVFVFFIFAFFLSGEYSLSVRGGNGTSLFLRILEKGSFK